MVSRKTCPINSAQLQRLSLLGLHTSINTDLSFEFSLSTEGIAGISLTSKNANATFGLCGNFNSDPADDLTATFWKTMEKWADSWCVEDCLGRSCPKCSSERPARFSDPEACGKILEINGPFTHCHGKVDPSSFYKHASLTCVFMEVSSLHYVTP